jgi:8-oxo-dGTP pyrophosphatase MutT (NUDIX family)
MIFALTDDQQVIVVQQYRHAVKEIATELPSGMIDSTDIDSSAAAQRELLEETGYRVNHIQALGVFDVSPPKSTVRAHAYLATGAHKTEGQKLEPSEAIAVSTVPLAEWLTMIAEGMVKDLGSIATTMRALQALKHVTLTTISSPSPS